MKVTLILLAIFSVTLSEKQNGVKTGLVTPRIVNGAEVIPHSIPYQVFVKVNVRRGNNVGDLPCGGSLISQKYILTAAHCLAGDDGIVLLGAHNITAIESSRMIIKVNKFTVHEDYDAGALNNDIGLIELPYKVNLSKAINVSLLPTRKEAQNSYAGVPARVSGWGLTKGGGSPSRVLLATDNPIITNSECKKFYPRNVRENQICLSGKDGKESCRLDSGGPLVELHHNKQIGIVSYGSEQCRTGIPTVYTRVGYFLDWIEKHSDLQVL